MKSKWTPICKNHEFRRIYGKGKSVVTPVAVVYMMRNRHQVTRIGITTSKKIGNAVQRNRSRRVIRAAVQALLPRMKQGCDYIFVARGKTPHVKSTDVLRHLQGKMLQAGFLYEPAKKQNNNSAAMKQPQR